MRPALVSFSILGLGSVLVFLSAEGCAPAGRGGASYYAGRMSPAALGEARRASIVRREFDARPPINLILRSGDPLPAVAFATAHDSGSVASVVLAALLSARVRAAGVGEVLTFPHALGVTLASLAENAGQAGLFVQATTSALGTPLAANDPALAALAQSLGALRARAFSGAAEAALATCSGELGLAPGSAVPDVSTAAGRAVVDAYRKVAYSWQTSAFAALGPSSFLDDAAGAVAHGNAWPSGASSDDPWPARDVTGVDVTDGPRWLSLALRVSDADRAIAAAETLADPDSLLIARLRVFAPSFRVERAVASARPRGACLRVDLRTDGADPGPAALQMARVADVVAEEADVEMAHVNLPGALDESAARPTDPREAVQAAAWRALVGRLDPGEPRRFVAVGTHASEKAAFSDFSAVLQRVAERAPETSIEARTRVESGQSEFWILLGSPCGTLAEGANDAGHTALGLALSARLRSSGVTLEPWTTPDGMGLLAHGPHADPSEDGRDQAERVARAMARALADDRIPNDTWIQAQNELFGDLGKRPRPGYARALEALSPARPSWLEARGTWQSASEATRDSVLAHRRDLLRGPLRIAVLANQDDAQGRVAAESLRRFFEPLRVSGPNCPAPSEVAVRSVKVQLDSSDSSAPESAYLGLSLKRSAASAEVNALLRLLGPAGGLLDRALAGAGIPGSASARALGSSRTSALIIEVNTSDADHDRAIAEMRRVFEGLAASAPTPDTMTNVDRARSAQALASSLDPRRRIVELWRGTPTGGRLDPSMFRALLAELRTAPQVVVAVTHKN